jgi:hypothetical protein
MQPAKSLRKLRSATTAYLEDGGALIHNIDTLLRDVRHALQELESREQAVVLKEQLLLQRETKLEALSDRVDAALQQLLASGASTSNSSSVDDSLTSDHEADCSSEVFEESLEKSESDSQALPNATTAKPLPSVNRFSSKRQKFRRRPQRP